MNRDETKRAIEVMQAFVDGKPIQFFDGDKWHDLGNEFRDQDCLWNWGQVDYRVKTEPREWYLFARREGEELRVSCNVPAGHHAIRVREVLENES